MTVRLLADAVMLLHFAFLLFVVLGGLLVLRYRWMAWLHVPALVWGLYIELSGAWCPLTSVENELRRAAGEAGYEGGFIQHYIYPLVYPAGLTRTIQAWLAGLLAAFNLLIYSYIFYAAKKARPPGRS